MNSAQDLELQISKQLEEKRRIVADQLASIAALEEQAASIRMKKDQIQSATKNLADKFKKDIAAQDEAKAALKKWEDTSKEVIAAYNELNILIESNMLKQHFDANTGLYPADFESVIQTHREHSADFSGLLTEKLSPLINTVNINLKSAQQVSSTFSSSMPQNLDVMITTSTTTKLEEQSESVFVEEFDLCSDNSAEGYKSDEPESKTKRLKIV